MPKSAVGMMVKDDAFYIGMALQSVIEHAEIIILDTGSTDGTLDIIRKFQEQYPGKIDLYRESFGSNEFADGDFRFAKGFRQMEARTYLMKLVYDKHPDYVLCIDADEVVNDRFWELIDQWPEALLHATDLAVTPYRVSIHPLDMQQVNGVKLFDPHIRAWRSDFGGEWYAREEFSDTHPMIKWAKEPKVTITTDNVHFHLHFSFGPKSIYSYMSVIEQTAQGASKTLGIPLNKMHDQKSFEDEFPEWFVNGRFIPCKIEENIAWNKHSKFCKEMSHPLPNYVVETWRNWGKWIDL